MRLPRHYCSECGMVVACTSRRAELVRTHQVRGGVCGGSLRRGIPRRDDEATHERVRKLLGRRPRLQGERIGP